MSSAYSRVGGSSLWQKGMGPWGVVPLACAEQSREASAPGGKGRETVGCPGPQAFAAVGSPRLSLGVPGEDVGRFCAEGSEAQLDIKGPIPSVPGNLSSPLSCPTCFLLFLSARERHALSVADVTLGCPGWCADLARSLSSCHTVRVPPELCTPG